MSHYLYIVYIPYFNQPETLSPSPEPAADDTDTAATPAAARPDKKARPSTPAVSGRASTPKLQWKPSMPSIAL